MVNKIELEAKKPGWCYCSFKAYLRFLHDRIFYKKTYTINREVLPKNGTPLLVVSNHQNCLNDPLGVLFAFTDRKVNVITRADVFALSPIANKFLRAIGLLPAFRLGWEGEAALGKNKETFKISEEALLNGNTVLMFPEGGHQDKRWLGDFSFGYTKLAFEAAEMGGFEKEVFILPACNHYSNYFGMQNRFMVKFGTPVSLQPYYELYKTKPRTAQREVNKLVRTQIESLMLNICDLENYDSIYFLADKWGDEYMRAQGLNPDNLPEKLDVEKEIVAVLAREQEDKASSGAFYARVKALMGGAKTLGVDYRNLVEAPCAWKTALQMLGLIILFPLFVLSLWPAWFMYAIAMSLFRKKCVDPMFEGTFLFAISALFTLPLFSLLTFIVAWLNAGLWFALAYVAFIPALILFAWKYKEWFKRVMQDVRSLKNRKRMQELVVLKEEIADKMSRLFLRRNES